jgi:hypothetical protein
VNTITEVVTITEFLTGLAGGLAGGSVILAAAALTAWVMNRAGAVLGRLHADRYY